MNVVVAIDPGASGGIAVWQDGLVCCRALPATGPDLVAFLETCQQSARALGHGISVVVEKVGGFVGKPQPGGAMFKFGFGCGYIEGLAAGLHLRLEYVTPQTWQKRLGIGTARACYSKLVWKNKLKAEAQRRFPQCTVTLATADALLILDYALAPVVFSDPANA